MSSAIRRHYLKHLLGALWLKPESALWYAHELEAVQSVLGRSFKGPSLEFGCMDGVNTFLVLGGEFSPSFDVYREVKWNENSHHWKSLDDDFFDAYNENEDFSGAIAKKPETRFDVGLSWRKAQLVKAGRLGIYDSLVQHDPKLPLTSLEDRKFATVWAPNLYWVDNLVPLLKQLRRTMIDGGRLVTIFPDRSLLPHLFYRFAEQTNPEWLKDLDRGRYGNAARQARTLAEWEITFKEAGFRIEQHRRFLPTLVAQVYDIGLRPFFPAMLDIYQTLRHKCPDDLPRIKQHWTELAHHFLSPMCDTEWMDAMQMEQVWHTFGVSAI